MDQESVGRVERLFAALRELRRELAGGGTRSERDDFLRAVKLAVEVGGLRSAWVGVVDHDRRVVISIAHAGAGVGTNELMEIDLRASGPVATAVEGRRAVIVHGPTSAVVPVVRRDEVTAVLVLDPPGAAFTEPLETSLAEAIASELGFAMDASDRDAERRATEARLRASEQRYRTILETAGDGIFVTDPDRRYIEVNPAGCAMVGYTREEMLTKRIDDLVAPEQLAARPVDPSKFRRGETFTVERRLVAKDGRRVDVELRGVVLSDGSLQSVARDVTETRRVQAENAANERMMSLGRLAQSVGHEINNPLAYLVLSLEQVRRELEALSPEQRDDIDLALSSASDGAARIAHIVRALSAFGRGEAETVKAVEVERAVDAALTLTRNRLEHVASVELALGETPLARANEFGLVQVLVNLLLNAADAMERTAREDRGLTISSRVAEGGRVVIEVADQGPGIPPADLDRIFDPFFTTKPVGKGTGIGLAISRSILASFGGALEAENRPTRGALFRVLLAEAKPDDANAAPAPTPAPPPRRRVLVIDDEPLVARTIALTLDGHDVEIAASVDAAIDACARQDFDCILCDVMMPHGNGMDLYAALGKTKPELLSRIVFMTGGAFTDAAAEFLESVPNRTLAKPFSAETLHEAVANAAA